MSYLLYSWGRLVEVTVGCEATYEGFRTIEMGLNELLVVLLGRLVNVTVGCEATYEEFRTTQAERKSACIILFQALPD